LGRAQARLIDTKELDSCAAPILPLIIDFQSPRTSCDCRLVSLKQLCQLHVCTQIWGRQSQADSDGRHHATGGDPVRARLILSGMGGCIPYRVIEVPALQGGVEPGHACVDFFFDNPRCQSSGESPATRRVPP
jgi:hypothetical protein